MSALLNGKTVDISGFCRIEDKEYMCKRKGASPHGWRTCNLWSFPRRFCKGDKSINKNKAFAHKRRRFLLQNKNEKIYSLQYTLPNGTIADSILFAPEPLGTVAIDSKFPLENYRRLVEKGLSERERELRSKAFDLDVKKHIDAIASKYIINGETTDQAIMFLPAEAIFAEINAYHNDLVEYAYKKNVWITSPTTLISTFTTIQVLLKNMERDKYAKIVHNELTKLGIEFQRYKERWDKLSRSIETVNKDVENLNITSDKITKKFEAISDVRLDDKQYLE